MNIFKFDANDFNKAKTNYLQNIAADQQTAAAMRFDNEVNWMLSIVRNNDKLRQCSAESVKLSLISAVQMGLTLNPTLKFCYLIPRWNKNENCFKASLDISYMGLVKLLTDSGTVSNVEARVIYANDEYEIEFGTKTKVKHKPTLKNRGEMLAVYAVAHIRGAKPQVELLTSDDIEVIKAASEGGAIWNKHAGEMWRKSAVKRLFKYLPKTHISDELISALSNENKTEETDFEILAADEVEPAGNGAAISNMFNENEQAPAPAKKIEPAPAQTPNNETLTAQVKQPTTKRENTLSKPFEAKTEKPKQETKPKQEKSEQPRKIGFELPREKPTTQKTGEMKRKDFSNGMNLNDIIKLM